MKTRIRNTFFVIIAMICMAFMFFVPESQATVSYDQGSGTWNNVRTWEDLRNAVDDINNDPSISEATINLADNIVCPYADNWTENYIIPEEDILIVNEGKKIIINGAQNGHTLTDLYLTGAGEVVINANLKSVGKEKEVESPFIASALTVANYHLLYQPNTLTVTLNGDILSQSGKKKDSTLPERGVYAEGNANVTINGNISFGGDDIGGVAATDNANVSINGDITSENERAEYGIRCSGNSTVTYAGNIDVKAIYGIYAKGDSNISVTGNICSDDGGDCVRATDNCNVTVTGNIENGITASAQSNVTVTGNVSGGANTNWNSDAGRGITAEDTANVVVHGDVTGGSMIYNAANPPYGDFYIGSAAAGIQMESGAAVKVFGNVTGGYTELKGSNGGHGAVIVLRAKSRENSAENKSGELYVSGTVSGSSSVDGKPGAGIGYYDYDDVFKNYTNGDDFDKYCNHLIIPKVTVFGLNKGGKTTLFVSNAGQDAAACQETAARFGKDTNYIVKIEKPQNGVVTADKKTAKAGETVVVKVRAKKGYELSELAVRGEILSPENGVYSFKMARDGFAEITAKFIPLGGGGSGGADGSGGKTDTGDKTPVAVLLAALIASLSGTAAVILSNKKKHYEK